MKWPGIKDLYIVENNILITTFVEHDIFIPSECIETKSDLNLFIELFKSNTSISPKHNYPDQIKFK
ncbi:hypothetical protein ACOAKC_12170 [Hathewaya histolytica]|uniref:hypothetical protein n=1 Tax=Hathewaya histolytica TaxID=1498 RepID=UPI003B68345D